MKKFVLVLVVSLMVSMYLGCDNIGDEITPPPEEKDIIENITYEIYIKGTDPYMEIDFIAKDGGETSVTVTEHHWTYEYNVNHTQGDIRYRPYISVSGTAQGGKMKMTVRIFNNGYIIKEETCQGGSESCQIVLQEDL